MSALAFTRTGSGPTVVLLHGLGSSSRSFDPVLGLLADRYDVVAVDLPGFGASSPLPSHVEPSPAALAASVAAVLDDLGLTAPHVVGNSLGGWVGLELAQLRPVASLTLLSPAGLWRRRTPVYCRVSLRASRWLARRAGRVLSWVVGSRVGRILVLGQTHGRPGRMTASQARGVLDAMASCVGFDAAYTATLNRHYAPSTPVAAPVSVAFGSRDVLLLPWQSRELDGLPADTRVERLPGCGHLPMSDDPDAVVSVINQTVRRAGSDCSAVGPGPDALILRRQPMV